MGSGISGISQEKAAVIPAEMYKGVAEYFPDWLPDIGIDESLLKYSGTDSNSVLTTYSDELINNMPGYVVSLGSNLASVRSVPNAVGLGALVLSMIMEICIKSICSKRSPQRNGDSYNMLQRVFGEEKASTVRDTVQEYVKRHIMHINNEQLLREELRRLEQQLSNDLTTLRNSLLQDGQMSTRGVKIWVNGASFHLQMLIHEARLNDRIGQSSSHYVYSITAAINEYLRDLDSLLPKYKTFKISTTLLSCVGGFSKPTCCIDDREEGWIFNHCLRGDNFAEPYMNYVFANYEPISGLKSYFSNIKNNLKTLIKQHNAFTLTSRA